MENILIIGISGVTCGGKTTVANQLQKMLPRSKIISQDDYFLKNDDPRHIWVKHLNHVNYDILSSLDMKKMHGDIVEYIKCKNVVNIPYLNFKTDFTGSLENGVKQNIYNKLIDSKFEVLIIEGFSIFNYEPLQDFFALKYYFLLEKDECFKRRNTRVYDPPDCDGYFDICVWPEHLKQRKEVEDNVKDVRYFNKKDQNPCDDILLDILNHYCTLYL